MRNPKTSHHHRFIDVVSALTNDLELGQSLIALFRLPPNLAYLKDGLERTALVLKRYQALAAEHLPKPSNPASLAESLEKIVAHDALLAGSIGEETRWPMGAITPDRAHPLRNYALATSHYWAGLFYTASDELRRANYDDLFSQFAIYLWSITGRADPTEYGRWIASWQRTGQIPAFSPGIPSSHDSRMQKAALAMRRLSHSSFATLHDHLSSDKGGEYLPDKIFAAMELGEEWWLERGKREGVALWKSLNELGLFIATAVPGWRRPGERRHFSSVKRSRPGKTRRPFQGDGHVRLAGTDWLIEAVSTDRDVDYELYKLCVQLPETVDDDPAADNYLEPPSSIGIAEDEEARPSLAERTARATGHLHQLARFYQMMPNSYGLPTGYELACIIEGLNSSGPHNSVSLAALLISASMALGRPLEETAKIRVCTSEQRPREPVEYLQDVRCWRVQIIGPDLAPLERSAEEHRIDTRNALPISQYLELPDTLRFDVLLSGYGGNQGRQDWNLTGRYTRRLRDEAQALMRGWLADDRISLSALHRPIYQAIVRAANGDLAPATMLTAQTHAHSKTLLHYSVYSERRLGNLFLIATQQIWANAIKPAAKVPAGVGRYYGNPTHPSESAIQNLVAACWQRLIDTDPALDLASYNNHYVIYTILMASLAQAWRPTISPTYQSIDTTTLASSWTDKSRSDATRRTGFIPPTLRQHLEYYIAHRDAMAAVSSAFQKARQQGHTFLWCAATPALPFNTIQVEGFRPKYFRETTQHEFGLPLYSLRRFARMTLLDYYRVRAEVVDALMGHTRMGLSPSEPLSTFRSSELKHVADTCMDDMLLRVAAKPMRSKLVVYS